MRLAAGLVIVLGVSAFACAPAAAESRSHTVTKILRSGQAVASDATVSVTPAGAKATSGIRVGESIPDGTRIDVPARVIVVVTSSGAKSITTIEPNSSITFVATDTGEVSQVNAGSAWFAIVHHALDFFYVNTAHSFVAAARGTNFNVRSDANEGLGNLLFLLNHRISIVRHQ